MAAVIGSAAVPYCGWTGCRFARFATAVLSRPCWWPYRAGPSKGPAETVELSSARSRAHGPMSFGPSRRLNDYLDETSKPGKEET